MKNTKNYEAPVAEMIEMQAPSVLMSSPDDGQIHQGSITESDAEF
jgi:hypothetical protein